MLLLWACIWTAYLSLCNAFSSPVKRSHSTHNLANARTLPRDTSGDPCGLVFQGGCKWIRDWAYQVQPNLTEILATLFTALDAYSCLASVPLNHTVASQFLQYYKDTLEFQSTLTYLKNPPTSYQQPPTDLLVGLDIIQRQLDTDVFSNEYAFELAVLDLVYSAHDGHTFFYGGASNVFGFGSPFQISSVSLDGVQPPEVYMTGKYLDDQVRTD